jgi:hypothetical protein
MRKMALKMGLSGPSIFGRYSCGSSKDIIA